MKWILFITILTLGCNTVIKDNGKDHDTKNYLWGFTGYGGGGAMFYPAVSPYDPDNAFVACDMTGSFVTYDGGESWRMFSLRGPVRYFVFDPVNPDIVYANSIALFKSTDRGKTWNITYPGPGEITGVVSRGDHAQERVITSDSTVRQVLALAVDPDNSMSLHAAIAVDKDIAYYITDDQGATWTKKKELNKVIKNIFIDPLSPKDNRTIYFCARNSISILKDGMWRNNPGPLNVSAINEFTGGYDKSNEKYIIYAISGKSYFNEEGDTSGIFYTEDGGQTWENRQDGLIKMHAGKNSMPEWRTIATSALHPEIVYVSYAGLKVHNDTTCIGVARSEDFGKTWNLSWKDRLTRTTSIYSTNYKKGWIDEKFGPTWGENPFSIAVSPADPNVCYTTDFGRTIKTSDGGKTWEQVYTKKKEGAGWISRGLEVTTGYNIVFDPFDKTHAFIANTDVGLMESHDGGDSWNSATINNGIPRNWINSTYWMEFDKDVKGRAWAAMSNTHDLPRPKMWRRTGVSGYKGGIVLTEDGGKTWKPVSGDIGEAAMTHVLADNLSSKGSRTLYACAFGKGVYKSVDGGMTWEQKNNGIDGKEPFAWRISKDEKNNILYLIVSRRSDDGSFENESDGAVYRSYDGAGSWEKLPLPAGTNGPTSILADVDNSDRILLSAWGRTSPGNFSPDEGGGIFLSSDNGRTWKQVLEKDQHIHDLTYDGRNQTFYACGFNGSAYRSEDRGETWIRINGYNFKWGKRVEPDPVNPEKIYIITFGGGVWHGPAKGDATAVEDILTPVFKR